MHRIRALLRFRFRSLCFRLLVFTNGFSVEIQKSLPISFLSFKIEGNNLIQKILKGKNDCNNKFNENYKEKSFSRIV